MLEAKQHGFIDRQLANLGKSLNPKSDESAKNSVSKPFSKLVDTCAAEFEAYIPYYY